LIFVNLKIIPAELQTHEAYTKDLLNFLSYDEKCHSVLERRRSVRPYGKDRFKDPDGFSNQLQVKPEDDQSCDDKATCRTNFDYDFSTIVPTLNSNN